MSSHPVAPDPFESFREKKQIERLEKHVKSSASIKCPPEDDSGSVSKLGPKGANSSGSIAKPGAKGATSGAMSKLAPKGGTSGAIRTHGAGANEAPKKRPSSAGRPTFDPEDRSWIY